MEANCPRFHVVETMTLADGRTIWLDTNKVPMHDAEGRVIGLLGTWEDITERRESEALLQEERDRFAQISMNAPGIIFALRRHSDGRMTFPYLSKAVEAIFGLDAERLEKDASAFFASIHPEEQESVQISFAQSASCSSPWRQTFQITCQANPVWLEGRATPVFEHGGSVLWQGFLIDVTERKRDEAILRFQHALLQSQTESSPDGILVVNESGRVLSYNRRFVDLWNIPLEVATTGIDQALLLLAKTRARDPERFTARVAEIYAFGND